MPAQPALNQRIELLMQQLPQQRQQLTRQTNLITSVLAARLCSPQALVAATLTGALVTVWWHGHDHSPNSLSAHQAKSQLGWDIVYQALWQNLWRPLLSQ
ncbi:hypothetical protein [Alkalimonas amylolytica]|uniref:Uncharacterized protein n=1 Tax=Alkalimonas amylolytica TaxID=152573 RepID=A0A1H4BGG5_ALKAM|nr:hypothetical protein [Alkalimonas amylolytica]SEA47253.1 hypothetical protein SAMN04488051_103350 [Alkalimonas amylolytica]